MLILTNNTLVCVFCKGRRSIAVRIYNKSKARLSCCQTAGFSWSAPSATQYLTALFSSCDTPLPCGFLPLNQRRKKRFTQIFKHCARSFKPGHLFVFSITTCEACRGVVWVCRLIHVCLYLCVDRSLKEKTACWFVKKAPADSPGPPVPADIHTVAAGLIAGLSSLKGKAAVHFIQLLSAFVAEQNGLISKCWFSFTGLSFS